MVDARMESHGGHGGWVSGCVGWMGGGGGGHLIMALGKLHRCGHDL